MAEDLTMLAPRLRVLLLEDEPGDATLVLCALRDSRTPSFVAIHEVTLTGALERIEISATFDVVLADLNLPDSRGLETLSRLQVAAPSLSIVVMTGLDDPDFAEQALVAGAQDYLVKSETSERAVVRSIRYAITRKHADIERKGMAERLAHSLAIENERLEEECSLARTMQFDLLPRRTRLDGYLQTHGVAVDGFFEPSFDIGGDLWGCADGEGGRPVFYAFDFSGHGVGAALNVFRLHTLLSEVDGQIIDPAATLDRLNQALFNLLPRGQYATIFLGIIDTVESTLTWAAGGAPRPILFDRDGGVQMLNSRGKPLGLSASTQYVNRVVPFPPHSCLFLYSDVMTESLGGDNQPVGEDGLVEMVRGFHSPGGIDISGLVGRFTDTVGSPMDDDMTALCITRVTEAPRFQAEVTMTDGGHRRHEVPSKAASFSEPRAAPLILTSRSFGAVAAGLTSPYHGFIEITAAGLGDVGEACLDAVERGGVCLSLDAGSAWACGMAAQLSSALRRRFAGERDWSGIDISIGEAVGNAIVHGSLGIESSLRETRAGLDRYNNAVRLGLSDPTRAGKRVEVTAVPLSDGRLEIAIYDRGTGFDMERRLDNSLSGSAKHGRGLALIRKVARSVVSRDGGRTLVITI